MGGRNKITRTMKIMQKVAVDKYVDRTNAVRICHKFLLTSDFLFFNCNTVILIVGNSARRLWYTW